MPKHKMTKACEITPAVKAAVYERDNERCVLCGAWVPKFFSNAHYIPRSHGGLGIEQNIFTACQECHDRYDKTTERPVLREKLRRYFMSKYENWDESKLIYSKWRDYESRNTDRQFI